MSASTTSSADPRDDVGLANRLAHEGADALDELVAGLVPELVVDLLEAVEVEQQQRRVTLVPGALVEDALELGLEAVAVVQAGQRIVVGEVAQLSLEPPALGDVEHLGDRV